MKRIILILAAVAALFTSCVKQEDDTMSPEEARWLKSFSMKAEPVATRASIDFSNGAITWNADDRVLVYVPESGQSAEYKYSDGVFVPVGTTALEIGDALAYAYYPADAFSVAAGAVTLTMPASVTADPGNKLPMGGIIPAGQIAAGKTRREGTFKSLGSMIWLKLTAVEGKEGTVTNVHLENTTLALTGAAEVSWNGEIPSLGAFSGDKSIDVACSKTLTTSEPAEFYLFVPAGDQENLRLTLSLQEVAGYKSEVKYSRTGTLSLARNKVLPLSLDVNGKQPNGISTADEFLAFAAAVNAGESTAEWENSEGWVNLLADIDFDGVSAFVPVGFVTAPWNSSFEPIITEGSGNPFTGKFDGNAHHIKNLHLVCNETVAGRHYGLFGFLAPGAIVQNFVIEENCSLTVSSSVSLSAGMIAGVVYDAEVRDVTSYAPLNYAGAATGFVHMALIGGCYAKDLGTTIDSVHNRGDISAPNTANNKGNAQAIHVAGIVGFTNSPANDSKRNVISSCNNYGDLTSQTGRTAGILGAANRCTDINDCENHGDQLNTMPTASAGRLGGIVCFITNNSSMSSCKNYGDITSTTNACVGGITCLPNAGTYRNLENYGEIVTDNANRGVFFGYVNQAAVFDGGIASGRVGAYNGGTTAWDVYPEADKVSYLGKQQNAQGSGYGTITITIATGDEPSADPSFDVEAGLRIFFIGNSFTKDAVEHLPGILAAAGMDDVQMVHMYYGGRTIPEYNSGYGTATDYHCYVCNPGETTWTDVSGKSLEVVAKSADWDVITIQEHTGRQLAWGWTDAEKTAVNELKAKLAADQSARGNTPEFYYILSQAYHDLSKAQNVTKPFTDTDTMWPVIAAQGRSAVEECGFDGVISTGAMLQNLRTSWANNSMGLTRDGYHMDFGLARYGASCTVFETIIGPKHDNETMSGNGFYPNVGTPVTQYNAPLALKAARYAIAKPYEVTDMSSEVDPTPEYELSISNAAELLDFAGRVNSGDVSAYTATVTLTADIDCSSISAWTPIGNARMSTWTATSLALSGTAFTGTFDGDGHSIKNLHMDFAPTEAAGCWGFFGVIGDGAVVKDLTFDSSCSLHVTTGVSGVFGVLAGLIQGATVDNVKNYAPITGGATSSIANNNAEGRVFTGSMAGMVMPSTNAELKNLLNAGQFGTEANPYSTGANMGNGGNGTHLGGIVGFITNANNQTLTTLTACRNTGDIYSTVGRTSGIAAALNRYGYLKNCENTGNVLHSGASANFRLGNITCIANDGCTLDGCINRGDLESTAGCSVAGVICLVNHNNVKVKDCASLGASLVSTAVNPDGDQTYSGVLYGRCQKTAQFSGCSVSGKIGKTKETLVTLTADNYFQYVGEKYPTNTTLNTTNITFAQ